MNRYSGVVIGLLLLVVGGFLYREISSSEVPREVEVPVFVEQAPRFFQDELVLADGEELYNFEFNRKEDNEGFIHYYRSLVNGKEEWDNFRRSGYDVGQNELVKNFTNELFDDLSTRERYEVVVDVEGEEMKVVVENFEGDFITKNRPEYTRYHSVGKALVEFEGQVREMEAFLERIYSSDYRKWLFFEGIESIGSRTYKFELWDEEGNFYLMDDTEVIGEHPAYQPHSWFVMKNNEGYMKKAFEMEVVEDYPRWRVSVGEMEFELEALKRKKGNWVYGEVKGNVDGKDVFGKYSFKKS